MDIRTVQHCVSNDPYFTKYVLSESQPGMVYSVQIQLPGDEPETWVCTCPGYHYRGQCKHITQIALEGICGWSEVDGPESQSDEERKASLCPRCGNNTSTHLALDNE